MNRRSAFTLVEMLMVVGIATGLGALLLPAVLAAEDTVERVLCAANLSHIGTALHAYAHEHAGYLPDCGASSALGGPVPADGRHFADHWDSAGTAGYPTNQTTGNQGNLWLLVRLGYIDAASFICPATADKPSLNRAGDESVTGFYAMNAATSQPTSAEREFLEKFSAGRCSYSFQNQFVHRNFDSAISPRSNSTTHIAVHSQDLAILADRNPYTRVSITRQRICSPTDEPDANSKNHAGRGQTVLYLSGAVEWRETPYAGAWRAELNQNDNIYRPDEGSPTDTTNVPRHTLDSYLVP